jgi:hypothetical protein
MLKVDTWEPKLDSGENFVLIVEVVLTRLKKDTVDFRYSYILRRDLLQVLRPVLPSTLSPIALRQAWFDRHEKIVICVREVIKIAAMDVPSEDA